LPDDLRQVLVEKDVRDELLTRTDAELLEQALGVVLDSVGGETQGLGDFRVREAAGKQGRNLALARVAPWASRRSVAARGPDAGSITIAMRSAAGSGFEPWRMTQPAPPGTVTTLPPPAFAAS
jgi:hypothetical protein